MASVPQLAIGSHVDASRTRITKGELVFLCLIVLLFVAIPILVILRQTDAYLSLLVVAQGLFGFASYPAVGQLSVRTRIALVCTLPFAPVALAVWLNSIILANCSVLPLVVHMIVRAVLAGVCRGNRASAAVGRIAFAAGALQGQLWLMLPRNLNFLTPEDHIGNLTGMAFGLVIVLALSVCRRGTTIVRLWASSALLTEFLLLANVVKGAVPHWYAPVAFIVLGVLSLVKSIEKFTSREHRAARLIQENIGIPSSAERIALVEKIESVVCNDDLKGDCSICLMPFEDGEVLRRLPCGHTFCDACIRTWLLGAQMPLCPNCRALVAPAELQNSSNV